jgi:hypothetical protein
LLEARLDLPGAQVDPPGITSQALQAGLVHNFAWQVTANRSGHHTGTLWVYWRPLVGETVPLLARPIQLQGYSILGLGAPASRWVGGFGLAGSLVLWISRKKITAKR